MSDLDFPGEYADESFSEKKIKEMVQPIPDPVKPDPLVEPAGTPPMTRESTVGAGAMLGGIQGASEGAAIGAAAGPGGMAAGGMIGGAIGGALGAGAGSYLDDLSKRLVMMSHGADVSEPGEYLKTSTKRALKEMGYDFGLTTLAGAAGQVTSRIGKPFIGALLGTRGEAAQAAKRAAQGQGIDVGAAHVTRFSLVKSASRVIGIFPLVGKPFIEGQTRIVGQIDDVGADLLNTIAPKSTRFEVGAEFAKGARAKFDKFSNVKAAFYDHFYDYANKISVPDVVPTENIRTLINDISDSAAKEQIKLADGSVMQRFKNDEFGIFLAQLSEVPDYLTVRQARGLQREVNELARNSKLQGYDVSRMGQLAEEIKTSIHSIDISRLPKEEAAEITRRLDKANTFYNTAKQIFETKTAQRIGRLEKGIFEPGVKRPGTITEDELFKTVFESGNPTALHDLRRIVGKNTFRKAVRQNIDEAYEASVLQPKEGSAIHEPMFSADRFEKKLKLNTQEGWAAMSEMLRGTGVSVKEWARFIQAAKIGSDIVIRDPATFVMRRMILIGGGGMAGGALAGSVLAGGGTVSLPTAALLTYALRKASAKLMNPVFLRDITAVITDGVPNFQKRAAMLRVMHALPEEEDDRS